MPIICHASVYSAEPAPTVANCCCASLCVLAGAMKVAHHEESGEGPVVAYMAPKMNAALDRVEQYTGVRVPLEQVRDDLGHSRAGLTGTGCRVSATDVSAAAVDDAHTILIQCCMCICVGCTAEGACGRLPADLCPQHGSAKPVVVHSRWIDSQPLVTPCCLWATIATCLLLHRRCTPCWCLLLAAWSCWAVFCSH